MKDLLHHLNKMNLTNDFKSNATFPWLDLRHPVYSEGMTSSIILIVLYGPVFLVSVAGNLASVIILAKFCSKTNLLKNLFLINLFVADFSGKLLIYLYTTLIWAFSNL